MIRNLYERICHAIESDDEGPEDISDRIAAAYAAADDATKAVIDDIFTSLTGWKLATLIERDPSDDDEDEDEDEEVSTR
jgi:cytochrome c551/c552